jgi:hypothetical protein
MRIEANVRRPLQAYGFTPYSLSQELRSLTICLGAPRGLLCACRLGGGGLQEGRQQRLEAVVRAHQPDSSYCKRWHDIDLRLLCFRTPRRCQCVGLLGSDQHAERRPSSLCRKTLMEKIFNFHPFPINFGKLPPHDIELHLNPAEDISKEPLLVFAFANPSLFYR